MAPNEDLPNIKSCLDLVVEIHDAKDCHFGLNKTGLFAKVQRNIWDKSVLKHFISFNSTLHE